MRFLLKQIPAYLFSILLALSVLTSPAEADEGLAAYLRADFATAFKEFKLAAEEGDAKAQFFLGNMYVLGLGVSVDFHLGYMFNYISAKNGYKPAIKSRDSLRLTVPHLMTEQEIDEIEQRAENWIQQHTTIFDRVWRHFSL